MTVADPTADLQVETATAGRAESMRQSLDRARKRLGAIDPERALQIVGGILVPTGIIAVLLGWYGASQATYDFQQIPYLISGGLLGVALSVVGGLAYFASWLTRLITHSAVQSQAAMAETGRQTATIVEAIDRLATELRTASAAGARPQRARLSAEPLPTADASPLVAAARGRVVHLPDCPAVAGRDDLAAVPVDTDLPPCRLCRPDHAGATV